MFARLIGLTAIMSITLAGAVVADQVSNTAELPTLDGRGGILATESGRYIFGPDTCAMWVEDGLHDIEIQGPGTDPDGRLFFFELSSTGRHLSVGFDIASVFDSPDEQLIADGFDVEVSGTAITVRDLVLRDQDGNLVGAGMLAIDCQSAS
ncbi:hypothetical protein [Devosia sp. A449]